MKITNLPGVPKFALCDSCKHRHDCRDANERMAICIAPFKLTGRDRAYKCDHAESRRQKRAVKDAVAAFVATLKRTDKSQITFKNGGIEYAAKPRNIRRANSRGGKAVLVHGSNIDFVKWCENCGAEMVTVNEDRLLCDDCWEEICGAMGVDYHQLCRNANFRGVR